MKNKHKVVLVTLQGANIGNRLQNYALQTVLEQKGYFVYTPLYNIPEYDTMNKRIKIRVKALLGICGVKKYELLIKRIKRERRYKAFDKKYISNGFKIDFDTMADKDWSLFDFAVTGSDQVWHNWSNNQNELKYFYLTFMPYNKRIAYAPSFGFDEFPLQDVGIHKEGINSMAALSAREFSGKKLMEQVLGRSVEMVLDPTLLINREEWTKIEKKPSCGLKDRYILTYFLGEKTHLYQDAIREQAQKLGNIQVVNIFDENQPEHYYTTPDEFLWLINHADFIMTDSFHACVFSVIYHKEFIAFNRQQQGFMNMFGRIETLLDMCGLKDCVFKESVKLSTEEHKTIDWSAVDDLIAIEQKKSLSYLYSAIDKI